MVPRTLLFGALSLASSTLALPSPPSPPSLVASGNYSCWGQSCDVAALSGSSGEPYNKTTPPKYSIPSGDCCVANYNPANRQQLYSLFPLLKTECRLFAVTPPPPPPEYPVQCAPKMIIYARGTNEAGPLDPIANGIKSAIQAAQPGQWNVIDTNYTNNIPGVFCLGMEGGIVAHQLFDRVAKQCPDTKFVLAGYSQGAMVAREAVSNSTNGNRVIGIVTFGDPFNGAPVKNYNGPIRIYCVTGDRVCYGEPIPLPVHGSYVNNITDAANYILTL